MNHDSRQNKRLASLISRSQCPATCGVFVRCHLSYLELLPRIPSPLLFWVGSNQKKNTYRVKSHHLYTLKSAVDTAPRLPAQATAHPATSRPTAGSAPSRLPLKWWRVPASPRVTCTLEVGGGEKQTPSRFPSGFQYILALPHFTFSSHCRPAARQSTVKSSPTYMQRQQPCRDFLTRNCGRAHWYKNSLVLNIIFRGIEI